MSDVLGKGEAYYRKWLKRLKGLVYFFYPTEVHGLENITDQPAIICANHSNFIDPVLIGEAFGPEHHIHFMAKEELRSKPVLGKFIENLGSFFVERGSSTGIDAVRNTMKCIRSGDKVMIFPEGTRVEEDGAADAKTGAVRMAAKLKVPIVPVYISRNKKFFRKAKLIIGKPIPVPAGTHEEYEAFAGQLMVDISEMGREEA